MRTLYLVLILTLAAGPAIAAAPVKKTKGGNPPTAQPDTTLVAPDPTPPPPTFPVTSRAVEMAPIGASSNAAHAAPPAPAPAAPPPPPQAPSASPEAPVVAHAEVCLRAEAPRAARAEASVKLAVDLLLEDLCGGEVDRAALYAHNVEALGRFTPQSERTAAGLSGARVDPETGEILDPPAGDVNGALSAAGLDRGAIDVPPQMRRFAAELVLAAKSDASAKSAEARKSH